MKFNRRIATYALIILSITAKADVIILSDGSTLKVSNLQVAPQWVFYTESEAEDAPIKKLAIGDVFAYKIGDGPMTNVNSSAVQSAPAAEPAAADNKGPKQLDPVPASDNQSLIAKYNDHPDITYKGKKPEPNKLTNYFLSIWGIEDGSVLSDANVEIGFDKVYQDNDNKGRVIGMQIKVTNKTASPIYLDLAACYKIMNGNHTMPYYTNSTYSVGSGKTQGASLNLGSVASAFGLGGFAGTIASGVNVGGGNSKSTEITTVEQQIISIPAHASVYLPGMKVSNGKEIIECYEPFYFSNTEMKTGRGGMIKTVLRSQDLTISEDKSNQRVPDMRNATSKSLDIHPWMQTNYTPENSPKHIGRVITYSTSPDFSTFTSLPVKLFLRGAYGIKGIGFNVVDFNDETYEVIPDYEYLIVGPGSVKK